MSNYLFLLLNSTGFRSIFSVVIHEPPRSRGRKSLVLKFPVAFPFPFSVRWPKLIFKRLHFIITHDVTFYDQFKSKNCLQVVRGRCREKYTMFHLYPMPNEYQPTQGVPFGF